MYLALQHLQSPFTIITSSAFCYMNHYSHVSKIKNLKVREVVKVRIKTRVQLFPSQCPTPTKRLCLQTHTKFALWSLDPLLLGQVSVIFNTYNSSDVIFWSKAIGEKREQRRAWEKEKREGKGCLAAGDLNPKGLFLVNCLHTKLYKGVVSKCRMVLTEMGSRPWSRDGKLSSWLWPGVEVHTPPRREELSHLLPPVPGKQLHINTEPDPKGKLWCAHPAELGFFKYFKRHLTCASRHDKNNSECLFQGAQEEINTFWFSPPLNSQWPKQ